MVVGCDLWCRYAVVIVRRVNRAAKQSGLWFRIEGGRDRGTEKKTKSNVHKFYTTTTHKSSRVTQLIRAPTNSPETVSLWLFFHAVESTALAWLPISCTLTFSVVDADH